MSGNHSTTPTPERKRRDRLDLFSFPLLSPAEIAQFSGRFKSVLFGPLGSEDRLEINPESGYISYSKATLNHPEGRDDSQRLPQTEAEAVEAALAFIREKHAAFLAEADLQSRIRQLHNAGKPLVKGFAPIPQADWLKLVEAYPVRNTAKGHADHWLVKFEVELPMPKGKAVHLLHASLDLRIGPPALSVYANVYEVWGMSMRYRPLVYAPQGPLEHFLEDTGSPGHHDSSESGEGESQGGHVHLGNETYISYILSDAHTPQYKLLPYEVTVEGGHHLAVLPATKESLWVEWRVEHDRDDYTIYALIMGGSGDYEAHWAYWRPFGGITDTGELAHQPEVKTATYQSAQAYPGVAVCTLKLPIAIWEFGISVLDRVHGNFIQTQHALTINPQREAFTSPSTTQEIFV